MRLLRLRSSWWLCAAFWLTIVGAKFVLIRGWATDVPYWDQWDAEGEQLIQQAEGHLTFVDLFRPHNEHRIFYTRALALTLTKLNHQWDARVEMTVNALLHATALTLLLALVARTLAGARLAGFAVLLAVLFALPYGWENTLAGFQSQFYFVVLFGLAHIGGTVLSRPGSRAWWFAQLAGTAGVLAMASGFLSAVVVGAFLFVRCACDRRWPAKAEWLTFAWCVVLTGVGFGLKTDVAGHAVLRATSVSGWLQSIAWLAAWPSPSPFACVAIAFPVGWIAVRAWRSHFADRAATLATGLGAWWALQTVLLAYARGGDAHGLSSRYFDTLAFGTVTGALAWAVLLFSGAEKRRGRRAITASIALVWLGVVVAGLNFQTRNEWANILRKLPAINAARESCVREFVAGRLPTLAGKQPWDELPYPDAARLESLLKEPALRAVLPASVRQPLTPQAKETPAHGFEAAAVPPEHVRPNEPVWSSHGRDLAAPAAWESMPLHTDFPLLRFQVSGDLAPPDGSLTLVGPEGDRRVQPAVPRRTNWGRVAVEVPTGEFHLEAISAAGHWLAFTAPIEVGRLTWLTNKTLRTGEALFWLGTLGLAGLLVGLSVCCSGAIAFRSIAAFFVATPGVVRRWRTTSIQFSRGHTGLLLTTSLFLFILGIKLAVIARFGSDLPIWDQLPREGDLTYIPWIQRHELLSHLFEAHNEHRIAPTLALNLSLMLFGGQWDARVQCVVNAFVHTAVAVGIYLWLARLGQKTWRIASACIVALLIAPPIAYDNLLTGFQSQFYFLIGLSLLAIYLLLNSKALSLRWWSGFMAGGITLVSMGSGLLCAIPIFLVSLPRLRQPGVDRRDAIATLVAAGILGIAGLLLHTSVPYHEQFHAHTIGQFLDYAVRCLAWPVYPHAWFAAVVWAPWLSGLAVWWAGLSRTRDARLDYVIAGGMWVLLQAAAVSYSRSGGGPLPANRYGDVFAIGGLFNYAALLVLSTRLRLRWTAPAVGLYVCCNIAAVGLALQPLREHELAARKDQVATFERNVQEFVLTDDYEAFLRHRNELPFPDPNWLQLILRRPEIRRILPVSVAVPKEIRDFAEPARLAFPPLPFRETRGLDRPGTWESAPLAPGRGWWKFETTGDLGQPGTSLALVSVADGHILGTIAPSKPAGAGWRAAYVPAPREPARLVAKLAVEGCPFAFSEPIWMSSLSYRCWWFAKYGSWLAAIGAIGVALGAATIVSERKSSARDISAKASNA
jgi:hypothetical protein